MKSIQKTQLLQGLRRLKSVKLLPLPLRSGCGVPFSTVWDMISTLSKRKSIKFSPGNSLSRPVLIATKGLHR